MAAYRLETATVRKIFMDTVIDLPLMASGEEAEATLHFIAGAYDMANAVIQAIEELGGK